MQTSHNATLKLGRATRPIAYLSLCMVIAAWGAMLAPAWCEWWAVFGSLGFVSAIGLDVRDRRRLRSILLERERQVSRWVEGKLDKVISGMQATDEIGDAVHQIMRSSAGAESQSGSRCEEARLPLHREITIAPLAKIAESADEFAGAPFIGYVRDISPRHVGLIHDRPVERGSVLLVFGLEGDARISFIADLLWCEVQDDGQYISGAKVMKLVTSGGARLAGPGISGRKPAQEMCA